jgi:hypothetical protein
MGMGGSRRPGAILGVIIAPGTARSTFVWMEFREDRVGAFPSRCAYSHSMPAGGLVEMS